MLFFTEPLFQPSALQNLKFYRYSGLANLFSTLFHRLIMFIAVDNSPLTKFCMYGAILDRQPIVVTSMALISSSTLYGRRFVYYPHLPPLTYLFSAPKDWDFAAFIFPIMDGPESDHVGRLGFYLR